MKRYSQQDVDHIRAQAYSHGVSVGQAGAIADGKKAADQSAARLRMLEAATRLTDAAAHAIQFALAK